LDISLPGNAFKIDARFGLVKYGIKAD